MAELLRSQRSFLVRLAYERSKPLRTHPQRGIHSLLPSTSGGFERRENVLIDPDRDSLFDRRLLRTTLTLFTTLGLFGPIRMNQTRRYSALEVLVRPLRIFFVSQVGIWLLHSPSPLV